MAVETHGWRPVAALLLFLAGVAGCHGGSGAPQPDGSAQGADSAPPGDGAAPQDDAGAEEGDSGADAGAEPPDGPAAPLARRPKLIEYGWDVPTAAFVSANIAAMERRPFDGVVFSIAGPPHAFETRAWTEADVQLDVLAGIKWSTFTDNFLILISEGDMKWFDDGNWSTIVANMELYSRAAEAGNLTGFVLDPEPYGGNLWGYSSTLYPDKTRAEVEAMVRRRGAQFMTALESHRPNMRLLCFFLLWDYLPGWQMWPAFVQGMLDAAGPGVRITDGNENSYYYNDTNQFFDYYASARRARSKVSAELRAKYDTQVDVGYALYMDYVLGKQPTDAMKGWFAHNVFYGMATTDEYVWCYSEKMSWWADNVFPGGEEGIRMARDKLAAAEPFGFDLVKGVAAAAPQVRITEPADGATLAAPASPVVTAVAAGDGVTKVVFYQSSQVVGEVDAPPYTFTLPALPAGATKLMARAFTATGHGTSQVVTVTVK